MCPTNKRAQRPDGQPDPVARINSTDLDAPGIDAKDASENDALISAEEARRRASRVKSPDVDLTAGVEFLQAQPNDAIDDASRAGKATPDPVDQKP